VELEGNELFSHDAINVDLSIDVAGGMSASQLST
jgi:hypothetical protein